MNLKNICLITRQTIFIFFISLTYFSISYAGPYVVNITFKNATADMYFENCEYNGNPYQVEGASYFNICAHSASDPYWKFHYGEGKSDFLAFLTTDGNVSPDRTHPKQQTKDSGFYYKYYNHGNYLEGNTCLDSWITSYTLIHPGGSFSHHFRNVSFDSEPSLTMRCTLYDPQKPDRRGPDGKKIKFGFKIHDDKSISWISNDPKVHHELMSSNSMDYGDSYNARLLSYEITYD